MEEEDYFLVANRILRQGRKSTTLDGLGQLLIKCGNHVNFGDLAAPDNQSSGV